MGALIEHQNQQLNMVNSSEQSNQTSHSAGSSVTTSTSNNNSNNSSSITLMAPSASSTATTSFSSSNNNNNNRNTLILYNSDAIEDKRKNLTLPLGSSSGGLGNHMHIGPNGFTPTNRRNGNFFFNPNNFKFE